MWTKTPIFLLFSLLVIIQFSHSQDSSLKQKDGNKTENESVVVYDISDFSLPELRVGVF